MFSYNCKCVCTNLINKEFYCFNKKVNFIFILFSNLKLNIIYTWSDHPVQLTRTLRLEVHNAIKKAAKNKACLSVAPAEINSGN